jgi:hypothetical protein
MPQSAEIDLAYPPSWEKAYRENGTVSVWHDEFPDLFRSCGYSARLGTLDLFPQYALMYLLRKQWGVMSVTWYSLADTSKKSKNRERTLAAWAIMRKWMGEATFDALRSALLAAGFSGFTGEPDLFCWHPESGKWFFAEAKGSDKLTKSQHKWFQVCRSALGDSTDIRVYRLRPKEHKTPNQALEGEPH